MNNLFKKYRELPLLGQVPLLGSIEPTANVKKLLFGAVAFSLVFTYITGILTTQDPRLFLSTSPVAFACLGFVGFLYLLSRFLSVFYCLPVLILLLLAILYLPRSLGSGVGMLLVAVGVIGIGKLFWKSKELIGLQLMMGAFAALAMLGSTLKPSLVGPVYITWFNNLERAAHGDLHQDHLFHSAIAAMIKNYGVSSTGLHGLVEIHYHVLFHKIIAAVSIVSGNPVLEVYGITPWIFFFPLLVMGLVLPVNLAGNHPGSSVNAHAWFWACILILLIPVLLGPWALWNSFITSESALVASCLFALSIPVLLKRSLSRIDVLILPLLAALISHAKGSVGVVFLCMLGLRTITYSMKDFLSWVCLILAAGFTFFVLFKSASGAADNFAQFDPFGFSFVRWFSPGGEALEWVSRSRIKLLQSVFVVASFLFFHYILSWVVLSRAFVCWRTSWQSPAVFLNLAAVLPTFAILSLFDLQSSMYYFTCVGMMAAFPFVLVMAANLSIKRERMVILFITILFASLFLNMNGLKEKFAGFSNSSHLVDSAFYQKLCEIREQPFEKNEVFNPMPDLLNANPIERISSKPFIFPAVSERVWVGLLDDSEISKGIYSYYGFADYFEKGSDGSRVLNTQEKLLDGKKIRSLALSPHE